MICAEEQINAIDFIGATVQNTTYTWSNDNSNIGLPSSGSGNIASFKAKNTTAEILVAQIIVTPTANGCIGTPQTFSITVNPTPTITKPADIIVCAGETIDKITFPGASVTGTSKKWTNDNTSIGLGANGNGNINAFTALNNTTDIITANITVIPSANNCEGIPVTFKISVKPFPSVVAPENKTYCNGITTDPITLTGTPTGIKYNITGGASIGLNNKTEVTEIPSFIALKGSATITITPVANGCTGNSVSYNVLVNPTPTVSISPASQEICSLGTTSLNLTGTVSGSTFEWTVAQITPAGSITGASDGTGNKIEQTLTNTTNSQATIKYTVVPKANGCSGTPISVTVKVNPTPQFDFTNKELCSPADLTSLELTNESTQGLIFTYFKNGAQVQNPTSVTAGNYTIKGTTSSGCNSQQDITVNATPELTVSLNAPTVCSNTSFTYELKTNIPDTEISWQRLANPNISSNTTGGGIGDIGENLSNSSDQSIEVTYEVTLTSPSGCNNIQEIKTIINPIPKLNNPSTDPQKDFIYNYIKCGGENFIFNPSSTTPNTSFHWERTQAGENPASNGNGNINEKLINSGVSDISAIYKIYISSNQCDNPNPYEIRVTVKPAPIVQASIVTNGAAENSDSKVVEICPGTSYVDLYSNATLNNTQNLPPEIGSWNFSNQSQRNLWSTNPSSGSRRWRTGQNGDIAYEIEYRCGFRNRDICTQDYEFDFQNTNSPFFVVNSFQYDGNFDNVILMSPSFSTVGYSDVILNFKHAYRDAGSIYNIEADIARVQISIDNGNWENLVSYTSSVGSENQMVQGLTNNEQEIRIPGNKNNIRIRFLYNTDERGYRGRGFWVIGNVSITGEGAEQPTVTWTRSDDDQWKSFDRNPKNIAVNTETTFTATYEYGSIDCPGRDTVNVIVRKPPEPKITANYCGDSKFIDIITDSNYASYLWQSQGSTIQSVPGEPWRLEVELAGTYTVTVTDDFGCTGTGSINISDELIQNGDFENGNNGFFTQYNYKPSPTNYQNNNSNAALWPEAAYAIDDNAHDYHPSFYGKDHTTGSGNFLMVNGYPTSNKVIWRVTIDNIQPNTNYYFSAWGMNLNPGSPARLQFKVNGKNTGTIANLNNAPKPTSNSQVNTSNWVQFYSNPFWNSEGATTAVLEIINLNTDAGVMTSDWMISHLER